MGLGVFDIVIMSVIFVAAVVYLYKKMKKGDSCSSCSDSKNCKLKK